MRFLPAILLSILLAPQLSQAQVTAALLSPETSAQPGRPLTVAVELEHQPTWHTYWVNAGTGYPTRIEWQLPPGWVAGEIAWPTPTAITAADGRVTGHGYTGTLYLPVSLTPPTTAVIGESVPLRAHVSWLMCSAEQCIPGQDTVTLQMPMSAQPTTPNSQLRAEIDRMPMPRQAPPHAFVASRSGQKVTLRISGLPALQAPHFFSADGFIQYDEPQAAQISGSDTLLSLTVADDGPNSQARLSGILAFTGPDGTYQGIQVDTPLTGGAVAIAKTADAPASANQGAGAAGGPDAASASGGMLLAFAWLGGLILNLMPCVFPVLGIKLMGFVSQAGHERGRIVMHGLAYTAGVLLSFWVLAGLLALLRMGGQQLAWGFQLQSAPFVFILATVMLIFALSLSGVFEFGARVMGMGSSVRWRSALAGSFFAGMLATLVATPCSAPFLAPALGAALAVSGTESFLIFTAIALGLSTPYLLLSMFPQAVARLPRPGRWMETFKQAMAFPLYGTVGYLIWILAGQTSDNGLLMALFGLTLIAMAVWLYGRTVTPGSSQLRVRVGLVAALALAVSGLQLGWPTRTSSAGEVVWEPWSAERVHQLQAEDRPIFVDFTARWCATCQVNKKVVFASQDVRDYFRQHQVATLEADWTNSDPRITAELARWHRSSVPFNLIYLPGKSEPAVLPAVLSPGTVLNVLRATGHQP